jgi:hypothetical protein
VGASIPPLSQIHPSGTSFFTQPESIRRSSPQPGVDLPQSRLCARVPGELLYIISKLDPGTRSFEQFERIVQSLQHAPQKRKAH